MKRHDEFSDDELKALKNEALYASEIELPVNVNSCNKGKACVGEAYFEQIEKCVLCGQLI